MILKAEDIHLVMSVIAKAVDDIDNRTTLESTDAELMILGRERVRLEILYDKFSLILLTQ